MYQDEIFLRAGIEGAPNTYRSRKAIDIFKAYPTVNTVEIWEPGNEYGTARPKAAPGVACYVMSYKAGKWIRPSKTIIHPQDMTARLAELHKREWAAKLEAQAEAKGQ